MQNVVWAPASGPQRALLSCPVFEALFGGARGGGKTDALLGDWAQHSSEYGEHAIGLVVRRSAKQLGEMFQRARALFQPLGAKFVGSPETGGMRVTMPGGGRLIFAYLRKDSDADEYQGWSITRLYVEEVGNFPSPVPVFKLVACLRSGHGVPCCFRATANPGGPGHAWVKARWIDPAPLGWKVIVDPVSGRERVFIPSRVQDNPFLGKDYVSNLRMAGNEELVRAWLEGDWNVMSGAYFPEWGTRHVIPTRALPTHWLRFRSMDWGSARPFSVGWWAQSDGTEGIPRGAMVRYREWYGSNGEPNVGLKLTAEEVADGIKRREAGDELAFGVADPAIFASDGGPSIAERMSKRGVLWRPADNARVARGGAMGGWDALRARLKGEDGKPMLYAMDVCRDLIRTLPMQQHDEARPEDMDSEGEDHAADETRYACMARPWQPVRVDAPPAWQPGVLRVNELREPAGRREARV